MTGQRASLEKYRELSRPLYQRGLRRWAPMAAVVVTGASALAFGGSFVVMLIAVTVAGAIASAAVQWQARRVEASAPDPAVQRIVDDALARVQDHAK